MYKPHIAYKLNPNSNTCVAIPRCGVHAARTQASSALVPGLQAQQLCIGLPDQLLSEPVRRRDKFGHPGV